MTSTTAESTDSVLRASRLSLTSVTVWELLVAVVLRGRRLARTLGQRAAGAHSSASCRRRMTPAPPIRSISPRGPVTTSSMRARDRPV